MHRILVEEKRWIGEARFLHALNYCMLLPGPEAQQLATYIGWLLHRTWGGVVAGILFVLPGFVAIMALSIDLRPVQGNARVEALFFGLKAAVLAVVVEAVLRIGRRALKNRAMVGARGAGLRRHLLLRRAVPADRPGCGAHRLGRRPAAAGLHSSAGGHGAAGGKVAPPTVLLDEQLRAHPPVARPGRCAWSLLVGLASGLPCRWLLVAIFGSRDVFGQMAVFFSKMAVVTFGGAYAVLAYVAQQAVERLWLAAARRDAGRARHGRDHARAADHGPAVRGLPGRLPRRRRPRPAAGRRRSAALLTTWVTFVPCFLWIFLGAPYIESAARQQGAAAPRLSAITAAVVGVILNLAVWFALHAMFGEVREVALGPLRLNLPVLASLDPWAASSSPPAPWSRCSASMSAC